MSVTDYSILQQASPRRELTPYAILPLLQFTLLPARYLEKSSSFAVQLKLQPVRAFRLLCGHIVSA